MAHHSGPDEKQHELMRSFFGRQDNQDRIEEAIEHLRADERMRPTGRYPQGALTEDDEGEIGIAITATGGKVVLAFGKAIDWTAFDAEMARSLAQLLLDRAGDCDGVRSVVRRVESTD